MITRLVYNNKAFKILNEYSFNFSNNEVTFNDVVIDFTGYTISDIPYKYQEIKIMQANNETNILDGNVLFTGYLDDINLSEMKLKKEDREMTLTLLSPLKMATRRSVSLIGTFKLKEAILRVIQPLIDDGFELKEINISDGQITTNYILETVENCMNDIGFKRNIFWYINERKEIFINSIDLLFGVSTKKTIDENKEEKGLLKLQPKISNIDYANVINFKNVRLIYSEKDIDIEEPLAKSQGYNIYPILTLEKTIKKGDIVSFDNPIIIDDNTLKDVVEERNSNDTCYSIYINIKISNTQNKLYEIKKPFENDVYKDIVKNGSMTFNNDNGEEGEIVFQRDSFFSNLITGFKWNYDGEGTITQIMSDTALRYTTMKFMYSEEINRLKGIISESGQIEKTVDYNSKWTTLQQLISYARSLMVQNSNTVNEVLLEYDINPNLKIGDIVQINAPSFYVRGKFAVKDISYKYYNDIDQSWQITLKSSDLISTYIDLFRPIEKEESSNNINTVILSEFVEERINEVHSLELDNTKYTLNFNL